MMVDGELYGRVSHARFDEVLAEYAASQHKNA